LQNQLTPGQAFPFDHPAFEALLFAPFSLLNYRAAYLAFLAFNVGLLGVTFWLLQPWMKNLRQIYWWLPGVLFLAFLSGMRCTYSVTGLNFTVGAIGCRLPMSKQKSRLCGRILDRLRTFQVSAYRADCVALSALEALAISGWIFSGCDHGCGYLRMGSRFVAKPGLCSVASVHERPVCLGGRPAQVQLGTKRNGESPGTVIWANE